MVTSFAAKLIFVAKCVKYKKSAAPTQASPYVDEKSLIRLLEKLAAHTEFRTLTKGAAASLYREVLTTFDQAFPILPWTSEWTLDPKTERFSSPGYLSPSTSPPLAKRCLQLGSYKSAFSTLLSLYENISLSLLSPSPS